MKPAEVFGVIVRTVGLLIVFEALWRAVGNLEVALEPPFPSGAEGNAWTIPFLIMQFLALLAGCACFFAADTIVRWSYPESPPGRD
jgi:hypothetical protein